VTSTPIIGDLAYPGAAVFFNLEIGEDIIVLSGYKAAVFAPM
jgi:hypothetical protein